MKVGAFLLDEPLPELVEPHALCVLRPWIDVGEVRLLAPCTPSKIVCLGLNYRSHAEEFKLTIPADQKRRYCRDHHREDRHPAAIEMAATG